jgi:hypothetical protein
MCAERILLYETISYVRTTPKTPQTPFTLF